MKSLSLSKEIREGKLNDLEIIKCLDIHHNQVLISTIGHYSIAALLAIGTPESKSKYEELMDDLDNWDKEIVKRIAEGMS